MSKEGNGAAGSEGGESNSGKIVIGEGENAKEYGVEEIENLIAQGAAATQAMQKIAPLQAVLDKYETTPDVFLSQAEGAFAVTRRAIEAGLVDEKTGELIVKPGVVKKEEAGGGRDFLNIGNEGGSGGKTLKIVEDALGKLEEISKRVERTEQGQLEILRGNLSREVKGKHPTLVDEDISKLFSRATADQTKGLFEHAADMEKEKAGSVAAIEKAFAEKHGLKYEELRNSLKEQDDGGGGAGTLFKGKKMSFGKGPRGRNEKDVVSPRDALHEFMQRQMKG